MADLNRLQPEPMRSDSNGDLLINPRSDAQALFFQEAINQSGAYHGKFVAGPLWNTFNHMRGADNLTARRVYGRDGLTWRLRGHLPSGVLDVPRFARRQGEGEGPNGMSYHTGRNCTNACTRMILDSVMPDGWVSDEVVLRRAVMHASVGVLDPDPEREDRLAYTRYLDEQNDCLLPDPRYLNIFHSEAFRRRAARKVDTCYIAGANFDFIESIVRRAKERKPGTLAYCITTLHSETSGSIQPHNVILNGLDDHTVRLLDPLPARETPERDLSLSSFAIRWAAVSNVAMLVLAHPVRGTPDC